LSRLSRWDLHPDKTVTHRFTLDQAAEAYDAADKGRSGKVVIVYE
jgi:threonine dehydrogenase-like Zn-dependent dehydrogenase